jgi:uncharacterized membrane protein
MDDAGPQPGGREPGGKDPGGKDPGGETIRTRARAKRARARPHTRGDASPSDPDENRTWERILRYRVPAAALLAAAVVGALPAEMTLASRLAIGWIVYVAAQIAIIFRTFSGRGTEELRDWAPQVDLHAPTFALFLIASAAASVMASLFVLSAAEGLPELWRLLHLLLGAFTVILTWFGIQSAFAVRYASMYYGGPDGAGEAGLDFPSEPEPDFYDFLYFSTCAGMTFEASDVRVRSRRFRRWLTFHGTFSFVFASINLALLVDIAASLI